MTGSVGEARLVGRGPALAALRSAVAGAAAGHGRLLLVHGEPGIGKTALLQASASASAGRALVLRGQCWAGDGAPPYWPWVQVVRAAQAEGADVGDAAVLLPEGPPRPASLDPGAADARFRLFDAVSRLLGGLAGQRPVLVVLDDLHWADDASLRLVEFAARHLAGSAVLLLGAYRDEEAGAGLRRLTGSSEQVALAGLTRPDVAALMAALTGAAPDGPEADRVWRRTGGNPFLVRELARLPGGPGREDPPAALCDAVRDVLGRRLARLPQPCVDLLSRAAAVGPEVRLEVLAQVARVAELPDLLARAADARVLVEAEPGVYRFTHDLFRETVLATLPSGRRAQLHLAVGRALEGLRRSGSPVHPAELAAHFAAAAAAAPAEAARYGRLAAEDAMARLAFEEGRGHAERALAALDLAAEPDPDERLRVLVQLGRARDRAGDVAGALVAYGAAAELARRMGSAPALAEAALGIHALGWRDTHDPSIAVLDEAARALPDTPTALRARVLAALARDLHRSRDPRAADRARILAEQAVRDARAVVEPGTLALALLAVHDAGWQRGSAEDRLPVVDEMLTAAEEAGDPEMAAQARLLRATALVELGDRRATAELREFCRRSQRLGHARARYAALTRRATLALLDDDLPEAARLAREGLALGEAMGERDARGVHETLAWALRSCSGARPGEDGEPEPRLDSQPWPQVPLLEAVVAVARGDLEAAGRALDGLRVDELPATDDLEVLAFAARAISAAGSEEQRRDLYELLARYAGRHVVVGGCASYFGAVDDHLGRLASSLGRVDEARRHFLTAEMLHERLGAPGFAARSRSAAAAAAPGPTTGTPGSGGPTALLSREGAVWRVAYGGTESLLPDVKGLRDLAVLLGAPGESVHSVELHRGHPPWAGADAVLDDQAKAAYRRRLRELEGEVDEAEALGDVDAAESARLERDALVRQLTAAVGLGGRDRRLGDESERARKAVSARVWEAVDRLGRTNPALGEHLRGSVRTGTWCTYAPDRPVAGMTSVSGAGAQAGPGRRTATGHGRSSGP